MHRPIVGIVLAVLILSLCAASGCGRPVRGPRFWWDDRQREKLPDDYMLPPAPPRTTEGAVGEPYHIKGLSPKEGERAARAEYERQRQGIPRVDSDDPERDRVVVTPVSGD